MSTCKLCGVDNSTKRDPNIMRCQVCVDTRRAEHRAKLKASVTHRPAKASKGSKERKRQALKRSNAKRALLGLEPFRVDMDTPRKYREVEDADISFDVGIDDLSGYGDDR